MRIALLFLCTNLIALLVGCATPQETQSVLPPVGPGPLAPLTGTSQGGLQVFSRLARQNDNQNQDTTDPAWYQHTDYSIYNLQFEQLKHVTNVAGHFELDPLVVKLPVGKYFVVAQSRSYQWEKILVVVKRGVVTQVHLDGRWSPPSDAAPTQIVTLPGGQPVGWRM